MHEEIIKRRTFAIISHPDAGKNLAEKTPGPAAGRKGQFSDGRLAAGKIIFNFI